MWHGKSIMPSHFVNPTSRSVADIPNQNFSPSSPDPAPKGENLTEIMKEF
jgi:hypothetical protein